MSSLSGRQTDSHLAYKGLWTDGSKALMRLFATDSLGLSNRPQAQPGPTRGVVSFELH